MKGKGRRATKAVRTRSGRRPSLPRMPKPLERRVLEERPESPDEVMVLEPLTRDPIVRVRGRTVGAWIDL